jgi:hypothetical protein
MTRDQLFVLAVQIADDDCRGLIECHGLAVLDKAQRLRWYEVDPNEEFSGWGIARALRYLEARGMLRRNAKNPLQVKVKP